MPVAYAVTYIFGTVGSAIVLALLGPALLGIDLEAACKRYEEKHGGKKEAGGPGTAWHQFELRAFRVREDGPVVGKTAQEAEALLPEQRVFVERIRRGGQIMDATADTVIEAGDIVAVAGRRECWSSLIGTRRRGSRRSRAAGGARRRRRRLRDQQGGRRQDAGRAGEDCPAARGVFLRKITRGATATDIPILPDTQMQPRRHPHARRTHPGHRRRDQGAGRIRTARPTSPTSRSSARRSPSARCSARSSTRSAACRSRCPPPAAR